MQNLQLKDDNREIVLPLPIHQCIEIAYRSMNGELVGAKDIANVYNLSLLKVIELMTNPTFGMMVHNLAVANARQAFDAVAFKRLINIAEFSPDEKAAISAIKTLSDVTGLNMSKSGNRKTEININLDSMVHQSDKSPFPGF